MYNILYINKGKGKIGKMRSQIIVYMTPIYNLYIAGPKYNLQATLKPN